MIQSGRIRLTQCPLATLARPVAPPRSLGPEPTQCNDQLKLSCSGFGSVTTSRNERGGRTRAKRVSSEAAGIALWRTISRPYVSAAAVLEHSAELAIKTAIDDGSHCRFDDICGG